MPTFITPTDITGTGGTTQWIDVDLSSYVPSGATGVILRVVCLGTGTILKIRQNGSTDDRTMFDANASAHYHCMVGVDAARVIERYTNATTIAEKWAIYLIGYFADEAVFFENWVSKGAVGGNTTWHDVDISSDTGDDTATAALVFSWQYDGGVRLNGSSASYLGSGNTYLYAVVGVDGSEIFECRSGIARDVFLIGYLTDQYTSVDPPNDVSFDSPLDTYTSLDVTASKTGYVVVADGTGSVGLRRSADTSFDIVTGTYGQLCHFCVGGSPEAEISADTLDLFETGYFTAPGLPIPIAQYHYRNH